MAKYFTELSITAFRGIKNLNIADLGDVNIIVGDNNSGKTSLLEAIQIISDPVEYNFFRVAGLRCNPAGTSNVSLIDATTSIMHKSTDDDDNESYILEVSAVSTKAKKQPQDSIIRGFEDGKRFYQRYIKAAAKYVSVLANGNESALLEFNVSSSNGIDNHTLIGSPDKISNSSHLKFISEVK
jgi:predicted ATP-dependent endonuclease of OLD family